MKRYSRAPEQDDLLRPRLEGLTDEELLSVDPRLTPEVRTVLSTEGSLSTRDAQGGTAPTAVAAQLGALEQQLGSVRSFAESRVIAGETGR